jgi:hypothetical protein
LRGRETERGGDGRMMEGGGWGALIVSISHSLTKIEDDVYAAQSSSVKLLV